MDGFTAGSFGGGFASAGACFGSPWLLRMGAFYLFDVAYNVSAMLLLLDLLGVFSNLTL